MIDGMSCIFKCGSDVVFFQIGILAEDFRAASAAGEQGENVGHPDALAANARPSSTNQGIGRNAIEMADHGLA